MMKQSFAAATGAACDMSASELQFRRGRDGCDPDAPAFVYLRE